MENNNGTTICQRAYAAEMRAEQAEENSEHRIVGYASVYESWANIDGMFKEKIARGAFDGCKFKDVVFSVNHDNTKIPLARSRNNKKSTMKLSVDETGLLMDALIDVDRNSTAMALYSATQRGDMSGMSLIFRVEEDRWENLDGKMPERTITKISEVYEVTAATFPYYPDTTLDARAKRSLESDKAALESAKRARAKKAGEIYKLRAKIKA